jgi:tetratricopeptide (TPR) repeat protein
MAKRKRKKKTNRKGQPRSTSAAYRDGLRQVDQALAAQGIRPTSDNWQEVVLEWVVPEGRDRDEMRHYVTSYASQLGVPWAREMLRMEVLFQVEDDLQAVEHFKRALSRYPPCPLLEIWIAGTMIRYAGDLWGARRILLHALDNLPDRARPHYEMGYLDYLLGDLRGALVHYDRAISLVTDDEAEVGARILYNRAVVRYQLDGDRKATMADLKQALKLYPGYTQARQVLRGLRWTKRKVRFVPW